MDAVILSWRPQNIFTIAIMIAVILTVYYIGGGIVHRARGG